MKRLRKSLPSKIRYYACGEYGETYGRPHYHACIFGHSFPDKTPWKKSNDQVLYRSDQLERIWPHGYSSIGNVTFQSAAYVARYLLKKVNGDQAEDHYKYPYEHIDPITGEIFDIQFDITPEYTNMSKGAKGGHGIGHGWYEKYKKDVYPSDQVIVNAKIVRPPKYYDQLYELDSPKNHQLLKNKRKAKALLHAEDQTPERLRVRCQVQKSQLKLLPRKVE